MNIVAVKPSRNWLGLLALGVVVGMASGLFGIGGGIMILPILVGIFRFDIRVAVGTSLLSVVPPALVGVVSYALEGNVNVVMAILLAGGSILGAPIGSWLLAKLPRRAVQWGFIVFIVAVIATLFLVVPARDATVAIDVWAGLALFGLGLFTGVMSGLLGIGGGVIVVPLSIIFFGVSDLVAKGTSLLMIIATGISGTLSNILRKNVDLRAALFIGLGAAVVTPAGVWTAHALPPRIANIVFAVFLGIIMVQLLVNVLRQKPQVDD